jgi:hypothetical protein
VKKKAKSKKKPDQPQADHVPGHPSRPAAPRRRFIRRRDHPVQEADPDLGGAGQDQAGGVEDHAPMIVVDEAAGTIAICLRGEVLGTIKPSPEMFRYYAAIARSNELEREVQRDVLRFTAEDIDRSLMGTEKPA